MKNPHLNLMSCGVIAFGFWATQPLIQADVLINEIGAADSERLLRPHEDGRQRLGWGLGWMDREFDDSSWATGDAPFGFGNDVVVTDVGEQMIDQTPSLYLRRTFTVSEENASKAEPFRLSAKVDGGFVAYINGFEIARGNLGRLNGFVYADQSAFADADKGKRVTFPSVVLASDVLVPGENVFSVQVQNRIPNQINERDDSIDTEMYFDASLNLGLGIFAGGSNIPLGIDKASWKYRVGHAEPSGGIVDWAHVVQPELDGDFANWIELHNNGAATVDIGGWHLTDDRDEAKKWAFPAGTSIEAGGYLVVLADSRDGIPGDYLHTNFGISADGEFLALNDASGDLVSDFGGRYPVQKPFHSYGRSLADASVEVYFSQPTPGAANAGPELADTVDAPDFEPSGGVYDDTTLVTLTSETEDVVIRYTTDGSEPTEFHGEIYTSPIVVEAIDEKTGTPIRARAFKDGFVASRDKSQTYLVGVNDVFKNIRTMSLVSDASYAFYAPHGVTTVEGGKGVGDDWRSNGIDDYYMPDMHGRAFERRVSMELIYPETGENVQVHGGLRLAASAWSRGRFTLRQTDRSPWQSSPAEKPSFNMFFRDEYGDEALDHGFVDKYPVQSFTQLRIRAGKNDINNPWIHDELSRRVMADTGQFSSVGIQAALFLNGVYKGFYNPVARLRGDLFNEFYGGEADWDVKHIDDWADGDGEAWAITEELLDKDLSVFENYQAVIEMVDPVNIADYFIVNLYGATWDWPHNNFVIARERSERGRWRAYMWDAEGTFGNRGGRPLTYNSMTADLRNPRRDPDDSLGTMWKPLIESPEFQMLFADRLQKHFFTEGGALTEESMLEHVENLENEIGPLMSFNGNGNIRTQPIKDWIARRADVLFKSAKQFEAVDLWSDVQTPFFAPDRAEIESGSTIEIKAGSLFSPQKGDIFYTVDGSDPRLPGGDPNPTAVFYDRGGPGFELAGTTTVKARVRLTSLFDRSGQWSALQELNFMVDVQTASAENLLVTELMVDPPATNEEEEALGYKRSDFEFVEFYNPTDTEVDLSDLRFSKGIQYIFAEGASSTITGKGYGVVVRNQAAFEKRYGAGLPVIGSYTGKLSNDGEELEINDGSYQPIMSFAFGMLAPWPEDPERGGRSLSLLASDGSANPNDAASWAFSSETGGSPGRAEGAGPSDPQPSGGYAIWKATQFEGADLANDAVSGLQADPDGDGLVNLLEFAFGTLPNDSSSTTAPVVSVKDGKLNLVAPRRTGISGLTYRVEISANLTDWQVAENVVEVGKASAGAGMENVTFELSDGLDGANYVRWRIQVAQ